jgi:type VI secretion system FHA domain protein
MGLLLEVISAQASSLGARRQFFVDSDARIGRQGDWVLEAEGVSRDHAHIVYLNDMYFIEGVGTNRITVNGAEIENHSPRKLNDGDVIAIDEFEIRVSSASQPAPLVPPSTARGHTPRPKPVPNPNGRRIRDILPDPLDPGPKEGPLPPRSTLDELLRGALDVVKPIGTAAQESAGRSTQWINELNLEGTASKSDNLIPAPPTPEPVGPPRASEPRGDEFAAFMQGLGLSGEQLTPEVARELGAIVKNVVEGTMKLLKAGGALRDEMRLPGTRIADINNNALKHSTSVKDAMRRLFVQRDESYLPPLESFGAAFQEIYAHEFAMQLAAREAYRGMLKQFAPDVLQQRFDKSVGRALVPAMTKARYWELYVERLQGFATDPDDAYASLFGKVFAKEYEREFSSRRRPGRGDKA